MAERGEELEQTLRELRDANRVLAAAVGAVRLAVMDSDRRREQNKQLLILLIGVMLYAIPALGSAWAGASQLTSPAGDWSLESILLLIPAAVLLLWMGAVGFCYFMIWWTTRRAISRLAIPTSAPASRSAEPGPVPADVVCCICRTAIPGGGDPERPLDPCALVLVGHYNKGRAEQKEQLFFCHSECFRKVVGLSEAELLPARAWTVGQFGHGMLPDLPPRPGAG